MSAALAERLEQARRQLGGKAVTGPLGLDEYQRFALKTNRTRLTSHDAADYLALGLFGETGSLLSEVKKKQRDPQVYFAYEASAIEEFGDVFWYFANLARHLKLRLSSIAQKATTGASPWDFEGNVDRPATFRELQKEGREFGEPLTGRDVEARLIDLAAKVGMLFDRMRSRSGIDRDGMTYALVEIMRALIKAADVAGISLERAAIGNISKTLDRYPIKRVWGAALDVGCDPDERLPARMEVRFREKSTPGGKPFVIQQWKGINIGDRLTDNSSTPDDYRYHDVFHLSYAAFLGWSPVLRALLRLKRKSVPEVDEQQDGARAIIAEEGVSNWIFSQGQRHNAFEGATNVDFGILKTVQQMVKGYEVDVRPIWMWEHAIIQGFSVFRQLRDNRGGTVVADLRRHRLTYRPPHERG